jgi:predicted dehydrogenase
VTGGLTHQEGYALGFRADPRCRLIGVADDAGITPRRAALNLRLAEELQIPVLPDFDAALRRPDIHIASVSTEHERQGPLAVRCANAGKHLYMDKPMAGSVPDAYALADAVGRAGVKGQMYTVLNLPQAQRAKRIVDSGRLGELRAIHCDMLFSKGNPGTAPLGSPRQEQYPPTQFRATDGKREMYNLAVYTLAMIRWLTRRKDFRSVRAVTANYFFAGHRNNDFEDFAALAVALEGGVNATITVGRIGWRGHARGGVNLVRLFGTRGSVTLEADFPRAEIVSDRGLAPVEVNPEDPMGFWRTTQPRATGRPTIDWLTPESQPARSDQSLFVDCIEQNREPEVTVADGAKIVEALFAGYKSAATGDVVALPLPRGG